MLNLSIVIPTYNRRFSLERALISIFNSKVEPFEIIVIDNGSLDDTYKYIKYKYPKVKIYKYLKRKGAYYSRLAGAKISNGDLIAYLEDDVIVPNNWIEKINKIFLDTNIGLVGSIVYNYNERPWLPSKKHRFFGHANIFLDITGFIQDVEYVNEAGMVFRKELLNSISVDEGMIGSDFGESMILSYSIHSLGYRIVGSPDIYILHYPQKQGGNRRFTNSKFVNLFYLYHNKYYIFLKYQKTSIFSLLINSILIIFGIVKQMYNYRSPLVLFYSLNGISLAIRNYIRLK